MYYVPLVHTNDIHDMFWGVARQHAHLQGCDAAARYEMT